MITDSKNIIYTFLKAQLDDLMAKYPEKINVLLTTESPQIENLLKTNKQIAYVVLSREMNEEEFNFLSDLFEQPVTYIGQYEEKKGGNLQVDFIDIEIQTASPQYRDDLYNLINYLFLYNRKQMIAQYYPVGLRMIKRISGRDLPTEQSQQQPTMIYKASLKFLVQTDLTYTTVEELVEDIIIDNIILDTSISNT